MSRPKFMLKVIYRNYNDAAEAVRKNEGYCPCKLTHCPENKCVCLQFRQRIADGDPGVCECGLYELVDDED